MIRCLGWDVDIDKNIGMEFLNKTEFIKQCGQSVINSKNVDFFMTLEEKFLRFKVLTMSIVCENKKEFLYYNNIIDDVIRLRLCLLTFI